MSFFSASDLKKAKIQVDVDQLSSSCGKCKLDKKAKYPKISVAGEGRKKILVIGEATSPEEAQYGTAFVNETGFFFNKLLYTHNISLNKDCWKINAVLCPTYKPTHNQIQCCLPNLQKLIYTLKPKTILACGSVAVTALFGDSFSDRSIFRWNLFCIPDEKYNCNIIPILHPAYVLNNVKDKNIVNQYTRDIAHVCKLIEKPFKKPIEYDKYVTVISDYHRLISLLKKIIRKKSTIAFDYETTGLKPYRNGHKIVTIGIAVSTKKAYAFPFDYKSHWTKSEFKHIKSLWTLILKDNKIQKITQNSKFEAIWSKQLFGVTPKCFFDTLMGMHIISNRKKITGLKFQTFVYFGVRPYDTSIKPYLKSKNGEFNTVEQAPFKDLLVYNGLDTIFTYMRFKQQIKILTANKDLLKAYNFFIRGLVVMGIMQHNGFNCSEKYYSKLTITLQNKVDKFAKELTTGREARNFQKAYNRPLKITSNADLGKLFYTVLGKPAIKTEKGAYKTDKSTLESLNLPFVSKLLQMKKYEKAKGTYVGQFLREIVNDKIHPFFDLHIPVSYRSSSSSPNWQNLPKRDPEIGAMIRKGLCPLDDYIFAENDFSGAEVITSAGYHHDPTFIYDVQHGDMHRDFATELWMLPPDMLNNDTYNSKQLKQAKMLRFFAKNNWTFAQFYGDYFGTCGRMLWENVIDENLVLPTGQPVKEYINSKGIYDLGEITNGQVSPGSFLEHCKNIEKKMWENRFPKYTQWKQSIIQQYQQHGFIESKFGFRFTGYMSKNQCCNYPIQSSSFHLLVDTLIRYNKFLCENKIRAKLIGQIHDSIILMIHKSEIKTALVELDNIVSSMQKRFSWLPIPMSMEYDLSRLGKNGGNFAEMKTFKSIKSIKDNSYLDYI